VDQSAGMLARARQRAGKATFVQADLRTYTDTGQYDYVVLFFVLHEMSLPERTAVLRRASGFLKQKGVLIVCDFSIPPRGVLRNLFPALLRLWESHHTTDILKNGFDREISHNRLSIRERVTLYGGRVQLLKLGLPLTIPPCNG